MSWHVSPLVYPAWDPLCFLVLGDYFLSHVRVVFDYNLFEHFLRPFLFFLFFWDPYNSNIGVFNVVTEVSETVLISFHSFFLILLHGSYFLYSIFHLTYPFFCLSYFFIDSFWCICISVIVLFITDCLFFSSSRSLLNISCTFLIRACIPFLRSWIIFTMITLNYFSGRLPISSLFIWSFGFLPCSFLCNIFLCHLILSNLPCLWSAFHRLQGRSSSCFYCLPPGG